MPDRSSQFIALTAHCAATAVLGAGDCDRCRMAAGRHRPHQPCRADRPHRTPAPPQAAPASPAREDSPGLVDEIGKLFDKLPKLKSPSETLDDLNTSARDAAGTLSNLTRPSLVSGRTICPISANGAPDCKAASDSLCQAKGFKEGKSLASDSAETCSARVLIPGRPRKPGDCRTDTYVTSALCQ